MAKAYKCDRCGKYFDKIEVDGKKYIFAKVEYGLLNERGIRENYNLKELCLECYEKLQKFLENENMDSEENTEPENNKIYSVEEVAEILNEHWCSQCVHNSPEGCTQKVSSLKYTCLVSIMNNMIPNNFKQKLEDKENEENGRKEN